MSQSKAAELTGLSRQEFLYALYRFNVSPFQVTPGEPREEIAGRRFEEVVSFFWASSRSMLPCNMAPSTA